MNDKITKDDIITSVPGSVMPASADKGSDDKRPQQDEQVGGSTTEEALSEVSKSLKDLTEELSTERMESKKERTQEKQKAPKPQKEITQPVSKDISGSTGGPSKEQQEALAAAGELGQGGLMSLAPELGMLVSSVSKPLKDLGSMTKKVATTTSDFFGKDKVQKAEVSPTSSSAPSATRSAKSSLTKKSELIENSGGVDKYLEEAEEVRDLRHKEMMEVLEEIRDGNSSESLGGVVGGIGKALGKLGGAIAGGFGLKKLFGKGSPKAPASPKSTKISPKAPASPKSPKVSSKTSSKALTKSTKSLSKPIKALSKPLGAVGRGVGKVAGGVVAPVLSLAQSAGTLTSFHREGVSNTVQRYKDEWSGEDWLNPSKMAAVAGDWGGEKVADVSSFIAGYKSPEENARRAEDSYHKMMEIRNRLKKEKKVATPTGIEPELATQQGTTKAATKVEELEVEPELATIVLPPEVSVTNQGVANQGVANLEELMSIPSSKSARIDNAMISRQVESKNSERVGEVMKESVTTSINNISNTQQAAVPPVPQSNLPTQSQSSPSINVPSNPNDLGLIGLQSGAI